MPHIEVLTTRADIGPDAVSLAVDVWPPSSFLWAINEGFRTESTDIGIEWTLADDTLASSALAELTLLVLGLKARPVTYSSKDAWADIPVMGEKKRGGCARSSKDLTVTTWPVCNPAMSAFPGLKTAMWS